MMTQSFTEALARLGSLLQHEGWPTELSWVSPEHIVSFPGNRAALYRPSPPGYGSEPARSFEAARGRGLPVELYGVGYAAGVSFAVVRPIEELAQGEHMFLTEGVKVGVAANAPSVQVVRSSVLWSFLQFRHRRWLRRRNLAPKTAA